MKLKKQILKITKMIKCSTLISIALGIMLGLGCIGGYETGTMDLTQFAIYLSLCFFVTFIVIVFYVCLDKLQRYIEYCIVKSRNTKRTPQKIHYA